MCLRYEMLRTVICGESTRCVLGIWNCRIRWLMRIVPFPVVYAVGGRGTKLRYIRIPDARAGDQLNVVLYVKNQELTEYVRGLVNITLCVYVACMLETWDTLNRDISRVHEMCVRDLEVSIWMILWCLCRFPWCTLWVYGEQIRDTSGSQTHVPGIN